MMGVVQVVRVLAALESQKAELWAREHELERYFGSSVKGGGQLLTGTMRKLDRLSCNLLLAMLSGCWS